MPSIWCHLLAVGLLMLSPALARPNPLLPELAPKENLAEELLNELVEDVQKLHQKEANYVQFLGEVAIRQQREEELIQQQQQQIQRAQLSGDDVTSLLDEFPVESSAARMARFQQSAPKSVPTLKSKDEKKSNHYMSLCHFKLCNMGRKRNSRFLHFW